MVQIYHPIFSLLAGISPALLLGFALGDCVPVSAAETGNQPTSNLDARIENLQQSYQNVVGQQQLEQQSRKVAQVEILEEVKNIIADTLEDLGGELPENTNAEGIFQFSATPPVVNSTYQPETQKVFKPAATGPNQFAQGHRSEWHRKQKENRDCDSCERRSHHRHGHQRYDDEDRKPRQQSHADWRRVREAFKRGHEALEEHAEGIEELEEEVDELDEEVETLEERLANLELWVKKLTRGEKVKAHHKHKKRGVDSSPGKKRDKPKNARQ